ncbi:AbrB/MazE/SpoVT family DNA-binding domain-containing protein [Candidatus Kaiserbacteria bacterium]|nr:AbrB/MazE/SpoVT family DNA-binding domain-containing protein [Candidatus Kaiserbacteria bacterium]
MATIQKWGNSLAVRIPRELAENLGLSEGKQVLVAKDGDILTVQPVKILQYSLKELLKGVTSKNKHETVDWGTPQGKEIW